MAPRTVEDRLREQYFELLPEIRRTVHEIETKVHYALLPIGRDLAGYERLIVTSRIKSCESAIDKLRRQFAEGLFDPGKDYTLVSLKDLAGVRVMTFPRTRIVAIEQVLREKVFRTWTPDPFREGSKLGFKFVGKCSRKSVVHAEYQIVPLLTGLFWEVEHAVIYKPDVSLRGITRRRTMTQKTDSVLHSLQGFENEFLRLLKESEGPPLPPA